MDGNKLVRILRGMAEDLEKFAGDQGVSYLVSNRLKRLSMDLERSGYLTEKSPCDIIDLTD